MDASAKERVDNLKERGNSWVDDEKDRISSTDISEHLNDTFIVKALVLSVPGTYAVWYINVLLISAIIGVNVTWLEPFDHVAFSPIVAEDGDHRPLVHWLSTVLTLTLATPWIIYFSIRPTKRATDVSTAITSLHFFLCTTITQETPENWIWWATMMPCGVFMGRVAEFMIARLPSKRRRAGRRVANQDVTPYAAWG